MTRFVQVAVPVPLHQLFAYALPDGADATPGCRVAVRFGPRRLIGLVVEGPLGEAPAGVDPARIRPIDEVLDARPLVPPDVLTLAAFLTDYYHAPPGEAYFSVMPTRVSGGRKGKVVELSTRSELVARFVRSPDESERIGAAMDRALSWLGTVKEATAGDIRDATNSDATVLRRLHKHGLIELTRRDVPRDPFARMPLVPDQAPPLTAAQTAAVDAVSANLGGFGGVLLQGVTGSGKTEVYLALIGQVLERGQGAIVLVPEIGLTPQLVARFRNRLGDRIAVQHSGLDPAARHEQWLRIGSGELPIVIGARSALFAPVPNLGLVVVDEEHDGSFKQDSAPRYNARDLALVRGRATGAPVVLGSATPALETWTNARRGKIERLVLAERATARDLPPVELVDLREAATRDEDGLFSEKLVEAIEEVLERKQQAILLLNRRGYASFLLCRACGEVMSCPSCSVSYTWHRRRERLVCHYCAKVAGKPGRCPACSDDALAEVGYGTERVEAVLNELLPEARTARMDRDTTRGRALLDLLSRFRRREVDVLIGTQMVAKGHDFPGVTLVGVMLADQGLKVPDFRAAERTFQLLTQVAGRAGRAEDPGRVLIQTYDPSHYALKYAVAHATDAFLEEELRRRQEQAFPPHRFLALIRLNGKDRVGTERHAATLTAALAESRARTLGGARGELLLQGPHVAPIERIKERWRFQILLNASSRALLHRCLSGARAELARPAPGGIRVALDVDPMTFL